MNSSALSKWLPYKLFYHQNQVLCRWIYAGEKKFTEPFFDETVLKCLSHPYNSNLFKSVADVQLLHQWSHGIDCIKPTAFIFHVSRCGSTLLSQLLSLPDQNIVLSEVPFLDELLRLPIKDSMIPEAHCDELYKAALSFYGQRRTKLERHLFIKVDSWHILFYNRLRKMYPGILFVLLYHTPNGVVCSHQRKRGIHAIPGILEAELFGFDPEEIKQLSLDVYLIKVLEKYYDAYIDVIQHDSQCLIANYSEGILNILKRIEDRIEMQFSKSELEKMKQRAAFDAKNPLDKFTELRGIPAELDNLQHCSELYSHLEEIRKSQ
jgi:hypothetical protein